MAEDDVVSKDRAAPSPPSPPPFVEVNCKSSGKTRRFAAGTNAGFAVSVMNKKLGTAIPVALYIEAIKEGEEPVAFGPNSVLVDYGKEWKLQTVTEIDLTTGDPRPGFRPNPMKPDGLQPTKTSKPISAVYILKILLAFVFIFVLGAIFTLALEYLPMLILSINSFM